MKISVITIDGTSASGKGTLAARLANHLNWHLLDSGAIYRSFAWGFLHDNLNFSSESYHKVLSRLVIQYSSDFKNAETHIEYAGQSIDALIREERYAQMASKLGAIPEVRHLLLNLQRQARRLPGLVADGRDMGTVIFPDAIVKFYLDADVKIRVERRYRQLKQLGISVSLSEVDQELSQRDHRDKHREVAPAQPGEDTIKIDTSHLDIDEVFLQLIEHIHALI